MDLQRGKYALVHLSSVVVIIPKVIEPNNRVPIMTGREGYLLFRATMLVRAQTISLEL